MNNDNLIIKCADLKNDDRFPVKYTGYGDDISPEFIMENLSPEAKSLIITLEDLDHPIKNFTHWIIWNIPAISIIPGSIPKDYTDTQDPNRPKEKHINIVSQYMYQTAI